MVSSVAKGLNDSFVEAVKVLIKWLERGDCSKKSCGMFYNMIQSTNGHIRRLINEKGDCNEALSKAHDAFSHHMHSITSQCKSVFTSAFFFSSSRFAF